MSVYAERQAISHNRAPTLRVMRRRRNARDEGEDEGGFWPPCPRESVESVLSVWGWRRFVGTKFLQVTIAGVIFLLFKRSRDACTRSTWQTKISSIMSNYNLGGVREGAIMSEICLRSHVLARNVSFPPSNVTFSIRQMNVFLSSLEVEASCCHANAENRHRHFHDPSPAGELSHIASQHSKALNGTSLPFKAEETIKTRLQTWKWIWHEFSYSPCRGFSTFFGSRTPLQV